MEDDSGEWFCSCGWLNGRNDRCIGCKAPAPWGADEDPWGPDPWDDGAYDCWPGFNDEVP